MKAYRKEEVDNLFNSWQNDLDQLDVVDAVVVPEGATNGDVIKAMFPQWNLREEIGFEYKLFGEKHKFEGLVDEEWWNAPYKESEV